MMELNDAEKEAMSSGRITPFLKIELWAKIQSRRLSEGKEELKVDFQPSTSTTNTVMTEEEENRIKNRRECNRIAALKCRKKKKEGKQKMQMILEELQDRNRSLKEQITAMESERELILERLNMPTTCLGVCEDFEDVVKPPDPFEDDDEELSDIYLRSSQEVPTTHEYPQPSCSAASATTPYSELSCEGGDIDSWIGSSFISLDGYLQ